MAKLEITVPPEAEVLLGQYGFRYKLHQSFYGIIVAGVAAIDCEASRAMVCYAFGFHPEGQSKIFFPPRKQGCATTRKIMFGCNILYSREELSTCYTHINQAIGNDGNRQEGIPAHCLGLDIKNKLPVVYNWSNLEEVAVAIKESCAYVNLECVQLYKAARTGSLCAPRSPFESLKGVTSLVQQEMLSATSNTSIRKEFNHLFHSVVTLVELLVKLFNEKAACVLVSCKGVIPIYDATLYSLISIAMTSKHAFCFLIEDIDLENDIPPPPKCTAMIPKQSKLIVNNRPVATVPYTINVTHTTADLKKIKDAKDALLKEAKKEAVMLEPPEDSQEIKEIISGSIKLRKIPSLDDCEPPKKKPKAEADFNLEDIFNN